MFTTVSPKQKTSHQSVNTTQTRAEFKHQADLRLTTSLEKERVRDYFLDNNDGWQMQALTRHVQEDEDRERQRKRDAEAGKVRQGDANRQGDLPWRTEPFSFCFSFLRRLVEPTYRNLPNARSMLYLYPKLEVTAQKK